MQIRNRWTGAVIFEDASPTMREAVLNAISKAANLTRANLTDADLTAANLTAANLTRANLTRANLTRANLTAADLTDANLTDADLTDADLTDADLTDAKAGLFRVLDAAPAEVAGLLSAVQEGRIAGTCYEGECSCLKGTIATLRGVKYHTMQDELAPMAGSAAEIWFLGMQPGQTPENHIISKITAEWIQEWQAKRAAANPQPVSAEQ